MFHCCSVLSSFDINVACDYRLIEMQTEEYWQQRQIHLAEQQKRRQKKQKRTTQHAQSVT